MVEPHRLEAPETAEVVDRDSRAEALLVDGLDRYFSGRYEEAIHLWTRVLFLDRSHARARAYIDRARTAIAEQQRRAEEMLQTTGDLIAAGHTDRARALLTQAVATSGEDERAAALRWQLERAERARPVAFQSASSAAVVDAVPLVSVSRFAGFGRAWLGAGVVAAIAILILGVPIVRDVFLSDTTQSELTVRTAAAQVRVLSSSDVALVRARTLYAGGRLAEALQALDRMDPESASRAVADALRVEIQQVLLAASRETRSRGPGRDGGPQ